MVVRTFAKENVMAMPWYFQATLQYLLVVTILVLVSFFTVYPAENRLGFGACNVWEYPYA